MVPMLTLFQFQAYLLRGLNSVRKHLSEMLLTIDFKKLISIFPSFKRMFSTFFNWVFLLKTPMICL